MNAHFKKMNPEDLTENFFRELDKEWMLVTGGVLDSYNMLTASWGAFGILWNKPVAFCFVRPTRYTYDFMEKHDFFTLSFFSPTHHGQLMICGSESGRSYDKMQINGLTPFSTPNNGVCFEESRLFIECKKLYFDDLDSSRFLDKDLENLYPSKDYHRFYIGEITGVWASRG